MVVIFTAIIAYIISLGSLFSVTNFLIYFE